MYVSDLKYFGLNPHYLNRINEKNIKKLRIIHFLSMAIPLILLLILLASVQRILWNSNGVSLIGIVVVAIVIILSLTCLFVCFKSSSYIKAFSIQKQFLGKTIIELKRAYFQSCSIENQEELRMFLAVMAYSDSEYAQECFDGDSLGTTQFISIEYLKSVFDSKKISASKFRCLTCDISNIFLNNNTLDDKKIGQYF